MESLGSCGGQITPNSFSWSEILLPKILSQEKNVTLNPGGRGGGGGTPSYGPYGLHGVWFNELGMFLRISYFFIIINENPS